MKLFESYGFPSPKLKSLNELHVTAGWTAAVSRVQDALVDGRLRLPPHKPALVLSTMADEVLNQESISNRTPFLSSLPDHSEGGRPGDNGSAGVGEGRAGAAGARAAVKTGRAGRGCGACSGRSRQPSTTRVHCQKQRLVCGSASRSELVITIR